MADIEKWKPSAFNIVLDSGDTRLLFNGSTAALIELNAAQAELITDSLIEIEHSGTSSNKQLLQCMVALGFVVPEHEDEYERERLRFKAAQSSCETLRIIIAPTMACNLRCSYCFQQNLKRGTTMTADIQKAVVDFVRCKVAHDTKLLVVQWFGGEPLLAYRQIQWMSDEFQHLCGERGITYYSEMLTNGTLLTPEIIDSFRHISLRAIQIPLDGAIPIYSSRKGMTVERAKSFHRFLIAHVQDLADITGSVTIRINVDVNNSSGGKDVVKMFTEHGVIDPRIDFRLGFINTSRGLIECIPHQCFTPAQFSNVELDFMRFLSEEGYRVYGRPAKRNHPCTAPIASSYTVDPEGRIGKCVPAIGTEESVFSRIYPHDMNRTLLETSSPDAPYSRFDPFSSGACKRCRLLPVCLGSCPKMHEPGAKLFCSLKEGLLERLRFYYGQPR